MSTSPLDDGITQFRVYEFDAAPDYFVRSCYEIGDAVLVSAGLLTPRPLGSRIRLPGEPADG